MLILTVIAWILIVITTFKLIGVEKEINKLLEHFKIDIE